MVRLLTDVPQQDLRKLETLSSEGDTEAVLSTLRKNLHPDQSDPTSHGSSTPDLQSFANAELEPQNRIAYPRLDTIDASVLEHSIFYSLNQPTVCLTWSLVSHKNNICSSLLVNSLLSWGCVCTMYFQVTFEK